MVQRHDAASVDAKGEPLSSDSILNLLDPDEDENEDAFRNLPDIQSYNQVLHAYAQYKTVHGSKRAEEILRALLQAYDPNPSNIYDDHYSTSLHQHDSDSMNLPILRKVAPNSVSVNSVVVTCKMNCYHEILQTRTMTRTIFSCFQTVPPTKQ